MGDQNYQTNFTEILEILLQQIPPFSSKSSSSGSSRNQKAVALRAETPASSNPQISALRPPFEAQEEGCASTTRRLVVRVRSPSGLYRVTLESRPPHALTVEDLYRAIRGHPRLGTLLKSQKLSRDAQGLEEITSASEPCVRKTLSVLGISHGDVIFLKPRNGRE